jgi:hypothetical protein
LIPPLKLGMSYDKELLPGDMSEEDLYVAYLDGKQWCVLESEVDTQTKTVTAGITHFSQYALMGKLSSSTQAPSPPASISPIPEVSPVLTANVVLSPTVAADPTGILAAKENPNRHLILKN